MPDTNGYERPAEAPSFDGPRPPIAAHWPAPPGGWEGESWVRVPLLDDAPGNGASTKPVLNPPPPGRSPGHGYAPIPERSRPKHLALTLSITGGMVVLVLIAGLVTVSALLARSYHRDRIQATVGMDQPVRDGAFQFTADRERCGVQEIGTPDDYQEPTGQFCMITLTIKNVGTTPALFADSIQRAYGPGDVWFSSDSEAGLYANPDPTIFFNDINPGNQVDAIVVYDIPASAHIVRLEVHENPGTKGAIIKIS